ncbi:MAG: flagellin [Planctomycetota bacterium]|mgnify:FL=1
MSLSIMNNTQSLAAQQSGDRNQRLLGKTFEQLSSGKRINHAADDPAGLIISEQLLSNLGGLQQALDNVEQSNSLIQTADSALGNIGDMLTQARSLALAAQSSATNDVSSTRANSNEFNALVSSIQRVASDAQFGTQKILDGSFIDKSVQAGAQAGQGVPLSIASATADSLGLSSLSLDTPEGATAALDAIDQAISTVTSQRGALGATQSNVLETASQSLSAQYANLSAANSTIADADMAKTATDMLRLKILVQASLAMQTQANQQPQSVLRLLGAA